MREVVYLSTGKLNEFVPEPRRALPAVKFHAGGSFAGVDVPSPGHVVSVLLPAADGDVDCLVASPLVVEYVNWSAGGQRRDR
ncbi:hypothetical protein [Salinispora cortesiana]|uniref:hypothetical protein n=1 Tax=Salinispora cortesiana TaxID=1305843 RepID=UPI000425E3AB|nr:hypothetical protein [Salinispora cortesiana]